MNKTLVVILSILFSTSVFSQMNEGELLTKNKILRIPFTHSDSTILLNTEIRNTKQLFMLDSGAPTFISDSLQQVFNFPVILEADLEDASAKQGKVIIVRIDTMKAGPFVFAGIPALVLQFKDSPIKCSGFTGNLGSNALRFLIARFDLRGGEVVLTDDSSLLKNKPRSFLPARVNEQSDIFFPVELNEGFRDTIHFDTGDASFYQLSERMANRFASKFPGNVFRKGNGVTSMGALGLPPATRQLILRPNSIKIQDESVTGYVNITSRSASRMGRYLLNYGVLTLDYPNRSYAFEKYPDPNLPSRYDFGFAIVSDGKKVFAGTVWEGGQAEGLGMRSGDLIISMNGMKFSNADFCQIEPLIKKTLVNSNEIEVQFLNESGELRSAKMKKFVYR